MNRVETNDGRECLGIVNVIRLSKSTSSQTSLVMGNGTIKMIFDDEDPFACDDVGICWMRNQGPSPSRNQGLHLIVHRHFPFMYMCCLNMRSVNQTRRLPKGQRHEKMEKDDHRKQSKKWDGEYKCVYPCEGRREGEDHLEGLGE